MLALGIAGCVVAALAGLVLAGVLAVRHRRVTKQPRIPPPPPDPAARRLYDSTVHPEDPETQELPIVPGDHC